MSGLRYFANPSTQPVRDAMMAGLLDCIITPGQGNVIPPGAWYCVDNGAYGKGYPGEQEWWLWLCKRTAGREDHCRFAVAPDVVGDAAATLARSLPWLPKIRALGIPAAFVAQDGMDQLPMPWDAFDVLFIGGTTEWKLGVPMAEIVREAKVRGKAVHMGRVNSLRRLGYAASIGCDSVDGTYISFGPNINLPKMLRWVTAVNAREVTP